MIPLSFETIFDQPVPLLPVPTELTAGQRPELQVVDRFTRGVAIVGRFALSPSLIGLKVDVVTSAALRVRVTMSTDATSQEWWHKRPPEHVTREDTATGRLMLIRSQGRTRTAVYLAPARDQHAATVTTRFELELAPGEVCSDGLLIIEAIDVADLPDWAGPRIMPYSQVGVRIDKIELSVGDGDPVRAVPYVGRKRDGFAPQLVVASPGPDGTIEPVHLRVRRQYPRAEVTAVRAFNKVVREARKRISSTAPTVPMHDAVRRWVTSGAIDLTGQSLETQTPVRARIELRDGSDHTDHAHADLHIEGAPAGESVILRLTADSAVADPATELGGMQPVWDTLTD